MKSIIISDVDDATAIDRDDSASQMGAGVRDQATYSLYVFLEFNSLSLKCAFF